MLKLNILTIDTVSIVLEAAPFLLLGSVLGAVIETYMPEHIFRKKLFQRKSTGLLMSVLMGFVLPTCECGVIPIARKLVKKGLPPYLAVVYMFAAPVINPIVIIATYVAFRFNIWMVLGRIGISALVAVVVGLVLSGRKDIFKGHIADDHSDCEHHHHHDGECCTVPEKTKGWKQKVEHILVHSAGEFLEMAKYLIVGALFAAAFRAFIPKEIILFFERGGLLSVLFMMVLAVLLSICSEADAFVASSFIRFPPFSQLAFVTIGPVVDLKLLLMYTGTFRKKTLVLVTVLPFLIILLVTGLLSYIPGGLQ